MKKLVLLSAACISFGAMALTPQSLPMDFGRTPAPLDDYGFAAQVDHNPFRVASRAESEELSMGWGYCGDPGNAFPYGFGEIRQAVMMPASLAADYAGAEVRSLSVGNPIDYMTYATTRQMVNPIKDATIWIAESLEGEPVATAKGTLTENGLDWSTIEFETPYVVSGDKDLYFGYTYYVDYEVLNDFNSQMLWSIVTDYAVPGNENSNFLYSTIAGVAADARNLEMTETPQWINFYYLTGANACVRANLYGDMLPTDKIDIVNIEMPRSVITGEDINVALEVVNMAGNQIGEVTIELAIEGQEVQKQVCKLITGVDYVTGEYLNGTIGYNGHAYALATFKSEKDCVSDFTVTVTEVNGNPNGGENSVYASQLLSLAEGYAKSNVVEEGTGTWCGWCVLGIAGMEYMNENYADRGFIGIALHIDDEMDVLRPGGAYEDYIEFYPTYPGAYMNRNRLNYFSPYPPTMEQLFLAEEGVPAVAELSAVVNVAENDDDEYVASLSVNTTFGLSLENADYSLAYAVVENKVGPYKQSNYCSGVDYDYYGYENQPEKILMKFNDVARNCSHPNAIEGSIPATLVKGESYSYSTDIVLSDVVKIKNGKLVVMLLNNKTGLIENACELSLDPEMTGIGAMTLQSTKAPIAYSADGMIRFRGAGKAAIYTVDGRKVADVKGGEGVAVRPGIYTVVSGNESVKIAVK